MERRTAEFTRLDERKRGWTTKKRQKFDVEKFQKNIVTAQSGHSILLSSLRSPPSLALLARVVTYSYFFLNSNTLR